MVQIVTLAGDRSQGREGVHSDRDSFSLILPCQELDWAMPITREDSASRSCLAKQSKEQRANERIGKRDRKANE